MFFWVMKTESKSIDMLSNIIYEDCIKLGGLLSENIL